MLRLGTGALRDAAASKARSAMLIEAQAQHGDNPFSPSAVIVNRRIPLYGQSQDYPDFTIQFKGRAAIFASRRLPGWSGKFSVPGGRESA